MRVNVKKYLSIIGVSVAMFLLAGCNPIEKIENKFGVKNECFEYLKGNNIEKISVQSKRDLGFKFIVTESSAISDMYTLLSKSKVSEEKSDLEPDYIFEFDLGDEKKIFYYVVGAEEGNFYNDEGAFSVSNRLDEGIMQNLSFIRTPREFEYIYYNTILGVLENIKDTIVDKNYKVGINIQGDVDCLKYVYSIDLKKFIEKANKIVPNVSLVNNNEDEYDFVLTVKNRGFDSTNFKTKITTNNKVEKINDEYFITAINEYKEWNIKISEPNNMPDNW